LSTGPEQGRENDRPYCLAQLAEVTQNSFAVKSRRLPNIGIGFGPGGRGVLWEVVPFRAQMSAIKSTKTRSARISIVAAMRSKFPDFSEYHRGRGNGVPTKITSSFK
jgi:hypothetical protein